LPGNKNCRYATIPKSNTAFWKKKISGNIKRDEVVKKQLKKQGWKILVLWECQLKPKKRERTLEKLLQKF
jgi:DNA mismatch endonuclease (patch repair protein)